MGMSLPPLIVFSTFRSIAKVVPLRAPTQPYPSAPVTEPGLHSLGYKARRVAEKRLR